MLFLIFFVAFFAIFVTALFNLGLGPASVRQRFRDKRAPLQTDWARILEKRHEFSQDRSTDRYTRYFTTFELPGEEHVELTLDGEAWGLLAEGDTGTLRRQGSRYLGFDRVPQNR